jgi:threonine synthase
LDAVRGTFECREIDPNFDQFEATAEHRTEVSV